MVVDNNGHETAEPQSDKPVTEQVRKLLDATGAEGEVSTREELQRLEQAYHLVEKALQ